jgi:hypothetical protein
LFGVRLTLLLERNFIAIRQRSYGGRVISDPSVTREPDSSDDKEEDLELCSYKKHVQEILHQRKRINTVVKR